MLTKEEIMKSALCILVAVMKEKKRRCSVEKIAIVNLSFEIRSCYYDEWMLMGMYYPIYS